jgi:septal ring factor EnvC (AmiA/AmiB activator)
MKLKLKVLPLLLLAGGSLVAQDCYYGNQYSQRQDLREDYQDLRHDYAQLDRLRADVARDRYQLDAALARGDEWQASRIAGDLARDQRAIDALRADINRDHHDIRNDQRQQNRSYWWWYR